MLATVDRSLPTAVAMASCVRWNSSPSRRYAVAFFDRVEILALDVLDQRHLEDVVAALGLHLAYDHGHTTETGLPARRATGVRPR